MILKSKPNLLLAEWVLLRASVPVNYKHVKCIIRIDKSKNDIITTVGNYKKTNNYFIFIKIMKLLEINNK